MEKMFPHSAHSLFLRETSFHEPFFELLIVAIYYMLDLVEPLGTHYGLPLQYWHYVPNIILCDGCVILHHGI
jgi:hypothetical protein